MNTIPNSYENPKLITIIKAIETASEELNVTKKALSQSTKEIYNIQKINTLISNYNKLVVEFRLLCEQENITCDWTYPKKDLYKIDNRSFGATDGTGRIGH